MFGDKATKLKFLIWADGKNLTKKVSHQAHLKSFPAYLAENLRDSLITLGSHVQIFKKVSHKVDLSNITDLGPKMASEVLE